MQTAWMQNLSFIQKQRSKPGYQRYTVQNRKARVSGLVNRNQSQDQVQEETNGLLQKPQSNQSVQSSYGGNQRC